jgi:methionine sulfoxide reductase heme-binding subunit
MTADSSTLFWITSRAAGTTAMALSSASVGVGLTMGGKLIKRGGPDRRVLHEILSLSVMVAIAVHGLALLGDTYFNFTPLNIALPFSAPYKNLLTSVGIFAGWGLIILGLSYYARRRIGLNRWKVLHRFTAVAWILGLIHAFAEGTDAGKTWFIALIGLTAAPALVLLAVRLARRPGRLAPNFGELSSHRPTNSPSF